MLTKKVVSCFVLLAVMLSNVSIENSFTLTIHAYDTSLNGCSTYVELPDRPDLILIPDGKTVTIVGYPSCVVRSKAEMGWYRWPTKATRSIKLSLRDQTPMILVGSLIIPTANGRKRSAEDAPEIIPSIAAGPKGKKIVMVDLRYPYGKPKVYLNGSLITVAAQFMAMGHQVEIVDLNIDNLNDETVHDKFRQADLIGVSVIGSPCIPSAIKLAQDLTAITAAPVLVGGQVIEKLIQTQFSALFSDTNAIRIETPEDLAMALECSAEAIPNAYQVSMIPVFRHLGDKLNIYLRHEMTLVLAQGCVFNCGFCAARKNQAEEHRGLEMFTADLRYLAQAAKNTGLKQIEFYASSLDFFQNPTTVAEHLQILAMVQEQENIRIRVRCLACMGSFLRANKAIPDFADLLQRAGLWCVGFGVDGADVETWKEQNKRHNKLTDIPLCLSRCTEIGARPEILMVLGFPPNPKLTLYKNMRSICKNVQHAFHISWHYPNAVLRPYLAKPFIPGNQGWDATDERIQAITQKPNLFYNLDFCALGSRFTHPRRWHRWVSNLSYLTIIGLLSPFGRCATSPLLPQGSGGIKGAIARIINRLMPFDR